jgi:hypothetical protein
MLFLGTVRDKKASLFFANTVCLEKAGNEETHRETKV